MSQMNRAVSPEEVYASAVLTSPPQGLATLPPSGDGRLRRTRGSSSDEDPMHGEMINQDFRAGGPNLCVFPGYTLVMEQNHPASAVWMTDDAFSRTISQILQNHAVEATSIGLFMRKSAIPHFSSEPPRSTVLITANKTRLDDSWVKACIEIRGYLLQRELLDVNVEIIDKRAVEKILAFSVLPTDPIVPLWPDICSRILNIIGREGWVALECFRRGTSYEASENPVTVILTVPYESEKDWKPVRESIVQILTQMALPDVAVSIIYGEILRTNGGDFDFGLPENAWETKAQCGMSIGLLDSDESGSTLGAFIELLNPKHEWKRLALTGFDCVFKDRSNDPTLPPTDQTIYRGWNANGIRPGDQNSQNYLKMSQPALGDHQSHIQSLNEEIDRENRHIENLEEKLNAGDPVIPKDLEIQGQREARVKYLLKYRDRVERFVSSGENYLGHIFSASGFRTTQEALPATLDWALTKVKKARNGINKFPPSGKFTFKSRFLTFENCRLLSPYPGAPKPNEHLYKLGRTTEFTEGNYSLLKSILLPSDYQRNQIQKETYEHAIVGKNHKSFSRPGDCGAVIFDLYCNFVGLLFAGNCGSNATYFTPAETLFEDIRKITGALDVRIPDE
ncbi:hypothetical protein FQN50_006498 [Emmonsiellopsis sp. PD_5]|nr:hypothetical protein FQN50_006498 [Emmonsiellopsis sp. PD_5]